jgi:hypothetical protein
MPCFCGEGDTPDHIDGKGQLMRLAVFCERMGLLLG